MTDLAYQDFGPRDTSYAACAGGHVPTVEVPDEVTGVLRDFLSR